MAPDEEKQLPDPGPGSGGGGDRIAALALEEGRIALREQWDSMERLRTRSTGFVATVLAVVAFVVGERAPGSASEAETIFAIAGVGGTVATAVFAGLVLAPRKDWVFTCSSETLAGDAWQIDEPERALARQLGRHANNNEEKLSSMHRLFLYEIIAGAVAVTGWLLHGGF